MSKPFQLLDDNRGDDGLNLQPAAASITADMIESLNALAARYRPVFSFWGGGRSVGTWSTPQYRQAWADVCQGAPRICGSFITMPTHGQALANQGLAMTVDGLDQQLGSMVAAHWSNEPAYYPSEADIGAISMSPRTVDRKVKEIAIGSNTANGPQLRSGVIYEPVNNDPIVSAIETTQRIPSDWVTPGSPILGERGSDGNLRSIRGWRDFYRANYKGRRPEFGWSCEASGAGANGPISVPETTYQYIFDRLTGQSGIAPTNVRSGITVPLVYSASGINTRVRIYIRIYASMTNGGGGTGSFAIYNRTGTAGAQAGPTTITHMPTVTSTTPAWYGCADGINFSEANDAYFLGAADQLYDRILLCAKTTNGSNPIRIHAWTMNVYNGVA